MAEYDESEYFSDSQEEIAEREAQEALRRMVRTEIRRVQTGAADADIAEDIAREEEQEAVEKRKSRPRWLMWINRVVTGDILLAEEVKKGYILLTILGAIFFVNIATIFASLHNDIRLNRLEKEVAILKERAIRASERRYKQTSHSAILRRLKERGIEISDPNSQPKILK